MKKTLWKVLYRLSDGGTTQVVVPAADKAEAEKKAIARARQQFGAIDLKWEASWKFSPPRRWFQRSRDGANTRNALGALCCHAWLAAFLTEYPISLAMLISLGAVAALISVMWVAAEIWRYRARRHMRKQLAEVPWPMMVASPAFGEVPIKHHPQRRLLIRTYGAYWKDGELVFPELLQGKNRMEELLR